MIEVKGLNYAVGERKILSDVSFGLESGCFCGIIGNNGSGKTTLLRCLTRNHDVGKGKIRIAGRDICSYSFKDLAKQTAFVPQRTELMFDFSAHQIVLMGRKPYQKPLYSDSSEDMKTVEMAMKQTDTWHLRNANARNLSGGEFQRIIIARALAQQTPVLMLDEPVSNLDIHHQFEIMSLLQSINAQGRSILIVLHDLNLAMQYCKQILLIQNGRVGAYGETKEILTKENIERYFDVRAEIIEKQGNLLTSHIVMTRSEKSL